MPQLTKRQGTRMRPHAEQPRVSSGKKASSDNLVGNRVKVEPATEEENPDTEVLEGSEASGGMFEALDLGVKAFAHRVGDRVGKIRKEMVEVSLEHPSHLFDRLEPAAARPTVPALEEGQGFLCIPAAPELVEQFLELPGFGHLEAGVAQPGKERLLHRAPVLRVS